MTPPEEQRAAAADLDDTADDLRALSNLQRLRLLHLLTRPHYGEEIAEVLGVARQSALKHIEKLEERGFVRAMHGRRQTGPVIEYQVVPQRLFALGVQISDLGKLQPEGGPSTRRVERTMMMPDEPGVPREPSDGALRAHLLVLGGPHAGMRQSLDGEGPRWTVGRDQDRDIVLDHDPYISGRHSEVQVAPGGFDLIDVFSANGTFLNFSKLPRGGRVALKVGDVVGIGHTHLVYQVE